MADEARDRALISRILPISTNVMIAVLASKYRCSGSPRITTTAL
jgi:hypothetical protein